METLTLLEQMNKQSVNRFLDFADPAHGVLRGDMGKLQCREGAMELARTVGAVIMALASGGVASGTTLDVFVGAGSLAGNAAAWTDQSAIFTSDFADVYSVRNGVANTPESGTFVFDSVSSRTDRLNQIYPNSGRQISFLISDGLHSFEGFTKPGVIMANIPGVYTVYAAPNFYYNSPDQSAPAGSYVYDPTPGGVVGMLTISEFPDVPVPEPVSWVFMLLGVGGVGASLRLRRAGKANAKRGSKPAGLNLLHLTMDSPPIAVD